MRVLSEDLKVIKLDDEVAVLPWFHTEGRLEMGGRVRVLQQRSHVLLAHKYSSSKEFVFVFI